MFVSREIAGRTQPGDRQSVAHQAQEGEKFVCHAFVNTQQLGCVILTDGEYPSRVAFGLIFKVMEEITKSFGPDVGKKYPSRVGIILLRVIVHTIYTPLTQI